MDFRYNDKSRQLLEQVRAFMKEHVYPIEEEIYTFNHDPKNLWVVPPQIEELKKIAKAQGLWNLVLPHEYHEYSPGLTQLEASIRRLEGLAPRTTVASSIAGWVGMNEGDACVILVEHAHRHLPQVERTRRAVGG